MTGAGGFIGSHLVEHLLTAGHEVRAFVRYTSRGDWGWLEQHREEAPSALTVVLGDITDSSTVAASVDGCDGVLHLAALIGIPYSYRAPSSYVDVNVGGTLNILEASRRLDVQRVVVTSTSEVYGTAQYVPIDERHPLQPQSPYSATKIAADSLAISFARSFDLPVTVVRPFNTYGPHQSPRAIIPTILGQIVAGARRIRLGNVAPRRDFTYVGDTVSGITSAITAPDITGATIHLGTGTSISMGDLAELCLRIAGWEAEVVHEASRDRPSASEVDILESDPSLAASVLGWRPTVTLEEGLALTLEAFRDAPPRSGRYEW